MKHHYVPNIGDWFQDQEIMTRFEVVAIDDEEGSVEVQYFSGEIEEYDLETWYQLALSLIPPPEDSSGPFEMSKEDFYFTDDDVLRPEDWNSPLSGISLDIEY
ncbi:MAG: DUF6763 family protein [Gammaproteobacteria bacterium]